MISRGNIVVEKVLLTAAFIELNVFVPNSILDLLHFQYFATRISYGRKLVLLVIQVFPLLAVAYGFYVLMYWISLKTKNAAFRFPFSGCLRNKFTVAQNVNQKNVIEKVLILRSLKKCGIASLCLIFTYLRWRAQTDL